MQGSELLSPRSEEPPDLKSSNDSAMPADLDIAFAKIVEAIDFNWPESLAVERIPIGIAKIVSAILVFAVFVVLARWAISILYSAVGSSEG
jgi:hypothetical protein